MSAASSFQWYIIHTMSSYEKKVAQAIKETAEQKGLSSYIEDVTVPIEDVIEIRKGRKVTAEKKFLPGYVLIKMQMNDQVWHMIKNIPRVTGFLGGKGKPYPVPQGEVDRIFKQIQEGIENPKHSVVFEVGESVKINDGPFESFIGTVEEIEEEKSRLKVSVSIFGRSTPVEVEFSQVEKV